MNCYETLGSHKMFHRCSWILNNKPLYYFTNKIHWTALERFLPAPFVLHIGRTAAKQETVMVPLDAKWDGLTMPSSSGDHESSNMDYVSPFQIYANAANHCRNFVERTNVVQKAAKVASSIHFMNSDDVVDTKIRTQTIAGLLDSWLVHSKESTVDYFCSWEHFNDDEV